MKEDPAPLIQPASVLEMGRLPTNPRFLLISFALAAFVHIYAVILLPAVLDIEFDADPVVEINLINDEIDDDNDLPTNYNVDRIEELSVGGSGPAPKPLELPEEPRGEELRRADDFSDTIWVPSAEPLGWYGKRLPWQGPPYRIENYGRDPAELEHTGLGKRRVFGCPGVLR
jgi:hypothetical protein